MFIIVFVEFVVLRNITKKTTHMLQGFDLFETLAAAHCWLLHGFVCHAVNLRCEDWEAGAGFLLSIAKKIEARSEVQAHRASFCAVVCALFTWS